MFCRLSLSSAPWNGNMPDNMTYVNTPNDQISVCGNAGSSLSTSGAIRKN